MPFLANGQLLTLQVRVWDNTSGQYANWSQAEPAWQSGLIAAGKSSQLAVIASAPPLFPPVELCSLRSFNIRYLTPVEMIEMNWFTFDGGGGVGTNVLGGQVTGTIGQPDAGLMTSGNLTLAGGFWALYGVAAIQTPGLPLLRLIHTPTNTVVASWPLPDLGFRLQASSDLSSGSAWSDVPPPYLNNGTELYYVEPLQAGPKFFRLRKSSL